MSENKNSVVLPKLEELLHAGVHFGHKASRWNPKMKPYIYSTREKVHIIDLVKSMKLLKIAIEAIVTAADKGSVLIVGTKGQAASMVEKVALESGAFYVNTRWPGGLFTNHKQIVKSVSKLLKMEESLATGAQGLVKKEQLLLGRDVGRQNKLYDGLKFMDALPSLIVVIDSKLEKNAIREANIANIPVVALVDTNCDPDLVTYPIPANDDSIKSISLFLEVFGRAIATGSRSERVVSLRNSHNAQLRNMAAEYAHKLELEREQAEEERLRMKLLRSGEKVESTTVVRVVKKSTSDESQTGSVARVSAPKRVTQKQATEKVEAPEKKDVAPAKKTTPKVEKAESKSASIESLELSTRATSALQEAGYKDVASLKPLKEADLTAIKGIGAVAAKEILKAVKKA